MTAWSDKFNEMPYEHRNIAAMCGVETNIQFLEFEKRRIKDRCDESIREINAHIKNLRDSLAMAAIESQA